MRRALLLCCMAALLLAVPAGAAQRERPVARGSTYLALGDSVSFGYRPSQTVPPPDYQRAFTFLGWPEHAALALRLRLVNASCPGETSASFIDPRAPSLGCENLPGNPDVGYRKAFPLHVKYSGSQLRFALTFLRRHPGTRLVTLMIGPNDLFLCQRTTPDGCASATERQTTLNRIGRNVRTIVSSLRRRAGYEGRVVLMRYYSLDFASPSITAIARVLNRTSYEAAKPYGVEVADGFGQWRAASVHSAGNACTAGLLLQLGQPGRCDVHPSWAGQSLLAQALARVVTR